MASLRILIEFFYFVFYFHCCPLFFFFFFFNDTATTEIYTLSLHDALPICTARASIRRPRRAPSASTCPTWGRSNSSDRKSTRLNSSHGYISYAVFCLKKKKKKQSHI